MIDERHYDKQWARNNNNNNNFTVQKVLLIIMLTIKILFTINSLKKTLPSKYYLQFLSFKKKHLVLIRKNSFD